MNYKREFKMLVRCLTIGLSVLISVLAQAETFVVAGNGSYVPYGDKRASFELRIVYEKEPSEGSRSESPIGAIRTIGKITLNFGAIDQTYPFYVTQFPDGANSLVGFYITNGYPHVLQFQSWSDDKSFYLYESYRKTKSVMKGTASLQNL